MIWIDVFIAAVLILIAIVDLKHKYIYTVHLIIVFVFSILHHLGHDYLPYLIGGIVGFLIGYLIYKVAYWYYKTEAFGFGDVLLLGVLGFYFGWPSFIHYFSITYLLVGLLSLCSLIFISWSKLRTITMPMAPVYVAGAFIFKFWGCPTLQNAYYDICIYVSAAIYKATMFFVLL